MTLLKEEGELLCRDVQMHYFYRRRALGPWCRRSAPAKRCFSILSLQMSWCRRGRVGRSAGAVSLEAGYVEASEPCWPLLLLLLPGQGDSPEEPSELSEVSLAPKTPLRSWLALASPAALQLRCPADVICAAAVPCAAGYQALKPPHWVFSPL